MESIGLPKSENLALTVFKAVPDSSPCGLPARTLRKAGPEPSGLRPPKGFGPPPVALAEGGPQAGDGSSSANRSGGLLGMTCKPGFSHGPHEGRPYDLASRSLTKRQRA